MEKLFNEKTSEKTKIKKRLKQKLQRQYTVIILNDPFTTFEFVEDILVTVFHKTKGEAIKIAHAIHSNGREIVGVYAKDIALTMVKRVHLEAVQREFPLKCIAEEC
ncbi:MAG: ATP-dependent Clp protease adaptor ClpS [Treponema sp.]|nr:ATP-dependent Clp protease adaptor ClpS [Treponema sp.]